jgi:type IV pilus assembly protein PilM
MIGIDVGSAGVRVVDVQTTRGGDRILKRYAHEALPGGAVRAGVVHDEDAVVRALKQAFRGAKIHGRRASLAATSAQAVVREISMPHLSPKERAGALPHLARDVLPIPIERAVLDFAPTSAPNESQVTGLLVGMPADVVSGLVSAVEKAGVAVESVDFAAFAALRSLPPAPIAAAACVTHDLGASTTTLVVEHGGSPQLVRVLARGGDDITAAVSERLGISHAEAEERKRHASLDTQGDVADVCRDALRPLMSEIRSSLDYFRSSHPGAGVGSMRIVGGGSSLGGIRAALATTLDLTVDVGDPLMLFAERRFDSERSLFAPHAAVAVGLTKEAANVA